MAASIEHLFAYGTLMPGKRNHGPIQYLVRDVRPATIDGVLVDRGRSPALLPGDGIVRGVVIDVEPQALIIADEIEDFRASVADSLYVRKRVVTTLADGSRIETWTYFFGDAARLANRPHCEAGHENGRTVYQWNGG